jgi:hypothetical protein
MNKSYIYKLTPVLFTILVLITACSEEDLTKLPPQSLPTELALSTEANVRQVLIGTYSALGSSNVLGGEMLRNSELLAADQEVTFTGTFDAPSQIWRKEILTSNDDVTGAWMDSYETINIVNNIEKAIQDGVVETGADELLGEVHFIRGLLYFELVKYFGKPYSAGNTTSNLGVPLVTTPTTAIGAESFVARNTVEEVYQQVLADLSSAASKLPADNGIFANSVAANAVLTRVHMQMGNLAQAKTSNDAALAAATGIYFLETSYANAFNADANTLEDIFSLQVTAVDGVNAMQTYYAPQAFGGRGDIEVEARHAGFYDPADDRLAFHYPDPSTTETRVGKWQNQFGNVAYIRLAELYLNRAEIEFTQNGASATVDADINLIRNRAGLGDIAVTQIEQIWLERKLELAHEGHALADFKRTQGAFYQLEPAAGAVDTSGDGLVDTFAYDADLLLFPIPDREMQVNANLVQNGSY